MHNIINQISPIFSVQQQDNQSIGLVCRRNKHTNNKDGGKQVGSRGISSLIRQGRCASRGGVGAPVEELGVGGVDCRRR